MAYLIIACTLHPCGRGFETGKGKKNKSVRNGSEVVVNIANINKFRI